MNSDGSGGRRRGSCSVWGFGAIHGIVCGANEQDHHVVSETIQLFVVH